MSDFWTNDSADLCSLASIGALWVPSFFQITAVELQMQQARENHQSQQFMYLLYNRIASCYNCLAFVFKLLFFLPVCSDSRYWSRGNIAPQKLGPQGFQLAEKLLPKFNAFIMHDVDLLPSEDMRQVYGRPPPDGYAVHLASVWESLDLK